MELYFLVALTISIATGVYLGNHPKIIKKIAIVISKLGIAGIFILLLLIAIVFLRKIIESWINSLFNTSFGLGMILLTLVIFGGPVYNLIRKNDDPITIALKKYKAIKVLAIIASILWFVLLMMSFFV